jgi:hypothetical protein
MTEGMSSREILRTELQEVRADGLRLPLRYAEQKTATLPIGQIVDMLTSIRSVSFDREALTVIPQVISHAARQAHGRLSGLLEGSTHEAAQMAALHLAVIVDQAEVMEVHGETAREALDVMYGALALAATKAAEAQQAIEAAHTEAERAVAAQAQFAERLGDYIEVV